MLRLGLGWPSSPVRWCLTPNKHLCLCCMRNWLEPGLQWSGLRSGCLWRCKMSRPRPGLVNSAAEREDAVTRSGRPPALSTCPPRPRLILYPWRTTSIQTQLSLHVWKKALRVDKKMVGFISQNQMGHAHKATLEMKLLSGFCLVTDSKWDVVT